MRLYTPGQKFFVIDYETTGIDTETDDAIEVGIIVTDERFNAIDSYQSLILPPDERGVAWSGSELHAFKVHGIHPDEFKVAKAHGLVALDIVALATKHLGKSKPVLVSDNIQFEWAFTKRLVAAAGREWPFHYCGWDSSLLLEATGVGDPKPAHRALADAGLLHSAIVKALDRTSNIGGAK